jgi:multiple antibiotic resistance protein
MVLHKIALLAFVTLVTMVNPLAVIPSFIAMTDGFTRRQRARIALNAGIATAVVLAAFLLAGNYLFRFFGITVPAFQIMGGIIFFTNALRTLVEDDRRIRNLGGARRTEDEQHEETHDDVDEPDDSSIAIVPLAIPMLSGPGAITSVMVLVNLYPKWGQKLAIIAAIVGVALVSYVALLAAVPLSRLIGERGRAVFSKIMALLLGAIGVQFVLNGLKPLMLEVLKAGN